MCVDIDSVCYVDDLTLVADTQEKLVDAMRILWDFSVDFSLDISGDKSFLWGSCPDRLHTIAAQWGIGVRESLCALGMEWAISKHAKPDYKKERARTREEVEERLERACHIPSPIVVKTQLIAMGCLSPLAFSPCPDLDALKPIARKVKVALGHSFAAPEALFAIFGRVLDVKCIWLLASLRLMHYMAKTQLGRCVLSIPNPKGRHSRFATVRKCINDLGWGFDGLRVITDFGLVSVGDSWERLKERSLMFYHATKLRALALRRPRVYEGLETIDTKQHERLLKKVHPYHAAVLIKVWTGAAMTGAHRKTIFPEHDDACECGHSPQSLHHLLYHCPLSPPPLPHVERWGRDLAFKAVALLCPKHLGPEGVKTWEDTCMRAVRAISRISTPVEAIDWKGHEITVSECKSIVLCIVGSAGWRGRQGT